jgi:hypothetical protein
MRRMRERQAAAIEPYRSPAPRDVDELLAPAIGETITALELGGKDVAAAQLARRYAAAIDQARSPAAALRALGPLLLKALESLGATPAARSAKARKPDQRAG